MATAPNSFRTQLERVRRPAPVFGTPTETLAKQDARAFFGGSAYDMADYTSRANNPRMNGVRNVTDAINDGDIVTPWAPSSGIRRGNTISGYSAENQGTGADKIRKWGGLSAPRPSLLNELYRNQPGKTMGAFDRLQSQKAMDETDPNAAFFADQMAVASGAGNWEKAAFMQQMLQDHLAMKQAGGGGAGGGTPPGSTMTGDGGAPGGRAYFRPGETRSDAAGNIWQWNEQLGRGELITKAPTMADVRAENEIGLWEPDAAFLGDGTLHTPFGTASVTQTDTPTTFDNGHGSSLGGVNFTGPNTGRQSASEFFQNAADFQRRENTYAVPSPGYNGRATAGFGEMGNPGNSKAWQHYNRAMDTKKKLKA